jgi:hypothetical protein
VEWNGMDMDPHYGSICGFRGMDLNPACLNTQPQKERKAHAHAHRETHTRATSTVLSISIFLLEAGSSNFRLWGGLGLTPIYLARSQSFRNVHNGSQLTTRSTDNDSILQIV